jgi:hypothetical protein
MIKWLIKENEELSLAWLAVVLPLASLAFWIPGVLILAPLQCFLPENICELAILLFLVGWLVFMATIWFRGTRAARQAKVRAVSPRIFHWLQGLGLVLMGANLLARGEALTSFFQWVDCMDVALAIFYVSYFLLALVTLTKVPWHAVTGIGIVLCSLVWEVFHNPFKHLL